MSRPIRIAYFDLGFSKEQYGLQPTRYGGGGVAARYLKEDPEIEFHILAHPEAFETLSPDEKRARCHGITLEVQRWLGSGGTLDAIPWSSTLNAFDLILHPHTCATINRGSFKGPIVHFCGFDGAAGHPGNDYTLFYDDSFAPRFGERAKYVRIGKPVPVQPPTRLASEDQALIPYIFQCSRHDDHMASIKVAAAARAAGVRAIFAGPIHNGYPLMEHVDGGLVQYLGEITEERKLGLCRKATLFALLPEWDPPFNQSIIEAQGQGTPIWTLPRGPFLSKYLKHGVNGFDAFKMDLSTAMRAARDINPEDCWKAAREYDTSVMVGSFKRAFREIVSEWYGPDHLKTG